MSSETNKSFITDLWERRVPQFFATYIGVCWGILQFLKFASERYGFNDTWIDKFLIFALILIPAVAIFTYNHGRPGRDMWKGYEKFLIPVNFVVALVFAGLFGSGSGVQASAQEVQITTETGDTITRIIPSLDNTKSFAVFPFKNLNADKKDDWMRLSYPLLLEYDMAQDMRTYFIEKDNIRYGYDSQQIDFEEDMNLSSMIKIAKDNISDFIVTGSFNSDADNHSIEVIIYETKTGEEFFKKSYNGSDIYSVIDQASKEVKANLFLNETSEYNAGIDLPCSDLFTSNPEALKYYSKAHYLLAQGSGNLDEVGPNIDKAYKLDSTSAEIISIKAVSTNISGALLSGGEIMKKALKYDGSLPERQKFNIRSRYYQLNQQVGNSLKILENWKTLYPNDYNPYKSLIDFKMIMQEFDDAKKLALEAKANGHNTRVLRSLANITTRRGELEEAEAYLEEYFKIFPEKRKDDKQLAEIYLKRGQFDKAIKYYENIELLNPNDHGVKIDISDALTKKGEFDKAIHKLNSDISSLELPRDKLSFYRELQKIHAQLGHSEEFVEIGEKKIQLLLENFPPNIVASNFLLRDLGNYYTLGAEEYITEKMDNIVKGDQTIMNLFECISNYIKALTFEDLELLENTYQGTCRQMLTQGHHYTYLAQSQIQNLKKNYTEAIQLAQTYIDSTGNEDGSDALLELYYNNKDYRQAITLIEKRLKIDPYNPRNLYFLSRSHLGNGEMEKAKESFQKLKTKVWNTMDPRHIFFKRMQDLEQELGLNG